MVFVLQLNHDDDDDDNDNNACLLNDKKGLTLTFLVSQAHKKITRSLPSRAAPPLSPISKSSCSIAKFLSTFHNHDRL